MFKLWAKSLAYIFPCCDEVSVELSVSMINGTVYRSCKVDLTSGILYPQMWIVECGCDKTEVSFNHCMAICFNFGTLTWRPLLDPSLIATIAINRACLSLRSNLWPNLHLIVSKPHRSEDTRNSSSSSPWRQVWKFLVWAKNPMMMSWMVISLTR